MIAIINKLINCCLSESSTLSENNEFALESISFEVNLLGIDVKEYPLGIWTETVS